MAGSNLRVCEKAGFASSLTKKRTAILSEFNTVEERTDRMNARRKTNCRAKSARGLREGHRGGTPQDQVGIEFVFAFLRGGSFAVDFIQQSAEGDLRQLFLRHLHGG